MLPSNESLVCMTKTQGRSNTRLCCQEGGAKYHPVCLHGPTDCEFETHAVKGPSMERLVLDVKNLVFYVCATTEDV